MDDKKSTAPMRHWIHRLFSSLIVGFMVVAGFPNLAFAEATIPLSTNGSISFSAGLRTSVELREDENDRGDVTSSLNLDSLRLGVAVKINPAIETVVKIDRNRDGDTRLVDAFVKIEPSEKVNVWAGRLVPPSDRSNLAGSYNLSSYTYPGLVSRYPGRVLGRDDGVAIWGKLFDRRLVYSFGLFRGHNRITGASGQGNQPLVTGRVALNFWEAEKAPGYYASSTYFGAANILTVGIVGQYQKNGVGSATRPGDFRAFSLDALMERKAFGGGAVLLEGAYYDYDTGGVVDVPNRFGGAGPIANVGNLREGRGFLLAGGVLLPFVIGPGKLQPVIRFQQFNPSGSSPHARQTDASLNYVIKGHSARLSLNYSRLRNKVSGNSARALLGLQLKY